MKRKKVYSERIIADIKRKSRDIGGSYRLCFDKGWIPVYVIETPGYNTIIVRAYGTDYDGNYLYTLKQYNETPKKYALN